jgi:hypothetical protein
MDLQFKQKVTFENVWKKDDRALHEEVVAIWKKFSTLNDEKMDERTSQLVYVVRNEENKIIGISTAFKAYIKQLKSHFYVYRCLITPGYGIPGMDAKLTVMSRDFLESIHEQDQPDKAIGLITLIHNPKLKERNLAIWPASGFAYIGNSKEGKHIRVYYFKGARITP